MKGTVRDYTVAIKWMIELEGINAAVAANNRGLDSNLITKEAFDAAAKVIKAKIDGPRPVSEAWAKEKARKAKRAEKLAAEMEAAIESGDIKRFEAAFYATANYMKQKERSNYYHRFMESHRVIPIYDSLEGRRIENAER